MVNLHHGGAAVAALNLQGSHVGAGSRDMGCYHFDIG